MTTPETRHPEAAQEKAAAIRRGAGLFRHADRGLIEVSGDDRTRWLGGMVTADVEALVAGPERSGCYALLLTPKGRIVADLHVVLRPDAFWLEVASDAVAGVVERLDRYIIADDVELAQRGDEMIRLGIEGPSAPEILARASGWRAAPAPEAAIDVEIGGVPVVVAAFGWTGEPAFQLFAASTSADALVDALRRADSEGVLVEGDVATLELMRVEAGVPRLGPDLDEEVLPAEAGLDRAISTTKGCYTGQEIVARLRSRGQVNHLLVGLTLESVAFDALFDLFDEERRIGELTSRASSRDAGEIALGYVRREYAEPGTRLKAGNGTATVTQLPFVAVGAGAELER